MIGFVFDLIDDHIGKIVVLVLGTVAVMCCYEVYIEMANPCVQYGPERLSFMQKVGDIMVPVYGKPCIQRKNDTEK